MPRKKPAPDIYLLARDWLGLPDQIVVIEDSRNGLLAASGARLTCVITVNDFTSDEDFSEAALVVSALGDPGGERAVVIANRAGITPGEWLTLTDLAHACHQGAPMSKATFGDVERVVHTIATVAVENEKYFGDLDAVVGDGDFGYSMARGFELVLADWDGFDRTDIGTFLKKIAVVITSRIGGTSGPLWGTAFLRAGAAAGTTTELDSVHVVAMLRAAIEGIKARGHRRRRQNAARRAHPCHGHHRGEYRGGARRRGHAAGSGSSGTRASRGNRSMQAMRGRASYTGERSIGTLDAGAVAVAVMFEALADLRPDRGAVIAQRRRQ